ncbi:MAG: hypothetical protein ACI4BI_00985 [Anaerotardibacter sp.]
MSEETYCEATILDENGNPIETNPTPLTKAKGVAQMAGGVALGAAGIPMLILPGPGAAAIAGGAALASKGHRNLTGRQATPLEEKLDTAAEKIGAVAKDQAKQFGEKAVAEAPHIASEALKQAPHVAKTISEKAPIVAEAVAQKAPEVAQVVAEKAPVYAKIITEKAPGAAESIAKSTPEVIGKVAHFASKKGPELGRKTLESAIIAGGMGKEATARILKTLKNSKNSQK